MTETTGYRTLENTGYGPKSDYRFPDVPPGAVVKSTLVDDLVSYWPLNEQSGQRNDVVGANHLTDNNTVTAVNRGPSGVVASFVAANSEYLSKASFAEPGTIWSLSGWFKTTDGVNDAIFSFADGASETMRLTIQSGAMYFVVDSSNTAGDPITNDQWYFAVAWCDGTKLYLSLNDATAKEATDALPAGTDLFTIGKDVSNRYMDGPIGGVGYWSRVLTAGERTSLFASGNGKTYADLTAAEKVGLVSYWNLDEVSGTRVDSHGSNNLTDNNTVGSVINAGGAMDGAAASFVAANSESLSGTLDLAANFTLAFWFNRTNQVAYAFPFVVGTDTRAFEIYTYAAGANVVFGSVTEDTTVVGTIFPAGQWVHCMVTFDGTALKLYTDNDLKGTDASFTLGANATISFGGTAVGYQSGLIDEVAIWSRVLTSDERAELYNAGAGFFYNATTEDFE